jgi:hypothetical protein
MPPKPKSSKNVGKKEEPKRDCLVAILADKSPHTRGPPAAPPEYPISSTMRNVLESAGVTISPSQGLISPIVSPVSSIDEQSPEEKPPSTLPLNSPKVETSLIIEILRQEVIDIRAHQDTRHDHLIDIINNLAIHQDTIAADITVSTTISRACMSKIDAFEQKIEDFLRESPDNNDDDANMPHLWPIPEVPIHTPMERSRPSPQMNQNSPTYHVEFDSLAPKVVLDTHFSISRSIPPVNPALSKVVFVFLCRHFVLRSERTF